MQGEGSEQIAEERKGCMNANWSIYVACGAPINFFPVLVTLVSRKDVVCID